MGYSMDQVPYPVQDQLLDAGSQLVGDQDHYPEADVEIMVVENKFMEGEDKEGSEVDMDVDVKDNFLLAILSET